MRHASLAARVCFVMSVLGLSPAFSQQGETPTYAPDDPRATHDPRDISDPRSASDPRLKTTDPRLPPQEFRHRLDALWSADVEGRLLDEIRAFQWETLEWIWDSCQRRQKILAKKDAMTPGDHETVDALSAKALSTAQLTDRALGDTRFVSWVEKILDWDEAERELYAHSQDLIRKADQQFMLGPGNTGNLSALTPLQQAYNIARLGGDVLTQARVRRRMGQLRFTHGLVFRAQADLSEALHLGRSLRDQGTVKSVLETQYAIAMEEGDLPHAIALVEEQRLLAIEGNDETQAMKKLGMRQTLESALASKKTILFRND
ncbi:MAG: hypothetical protein VX916_03415 [Planctomycetota bacterium]|nr:hypothetical protein [Planctomycetota bacterium]